jgi:hypothetical protein
MPRTSFKSGLARVSLHREGASQIQISHYCRHQCRDRDENAERFIAASQNDCSRADLLHLRSSSPESLQEIGGRVRRKAKAAARPTDPFTACLTDTCLTDTPRHALQTRLTPKHALQTRVKPRHALQIRVKPRLRIWPVCPPLDTDPKDSDVPHILSGEDMPETLEPPANTEHALNVSVNRCHSLTNVIVVVVTTRDARLRKLKIVVFDDGRRDVSSSTSSLIKIVVVVTTRDTRLLLPRC